MGSETGAEIAVVVLAHNGLDDTLACLRSLERVRRADMTVIVVDNASSDGTPGAVRRHHPQVEVIELPENAGFSAGNNVGLRRALDLGAAYALLLNNDTIVEPGALDELVRVAEEHPDAGSVCPYIPFASEPEVLWYGGARFNPRRGYPGRLQAYRKQASSEQRPHVTDRAAGAAMLVPRAVLERVGLLDERYFFLYEDVEWSLRMRRLGLATYVVPGARVLHSVASAQGGERSVSSAYYGIRNQLVVCSEYAPLGRLASCRREGMAVLVYLVRSLRSPRRGASVRAVFEGWRDFRRGQLGPRGGHRSP